MADATGEECCAFISKRSKDVSSKLALTLLPAFLASPTNGKVLQTLLKLDSDTLEIFEQGDAAAQKMLWPKYSVPADVATWLYTLVSEVGLL